MTPKKMKAEMARRFPGLEVQSASTGAGRASVSIRARDGLRMSIMYKQQDNPPDLTPDELEKEFRDWFDRARLKTWGEA